MNGFRVAIVGRPNVGKSTLFNRLVGRKLALVDDTPGVTRDRREGAAYLAGLSFTAIDTAGLEDVSDDSLEARMRRQTEAAVSHADMVLFIIDARAGVTPVDRHFAQLLRRAVAPVRLIANKAEGQAGRNILAEAYELGLGEPVLISAEHGEGMGDLYEAIAPFAPEDEPDSEQTALKPLHLAIAGRPNVGKSTLINRLIGEERLLTGPEAGITRDSISVPFYWGERAITLVDTAGIRRRPRVQSKLEKLSVADTLRTIRYAEVVAVVVDAVQGIDKQDLAIAGMVIEEGRALVIVLNKWDKVEDRAKALQEARDRLEASLSQVKGFHIVTVSAREGRNLDRMLEACFAVHQTWNKRASTADVNRWLQGALDQNPPPLVDGRRIKIRYGTQIKTRPPTFALFCAKAADLPGSYQRFLENSLRETFNLQGVPLRIVLRRPKNPFADED